DVPWSPTFDYMTDVVRPAFARLGLHFEAEATSRGFYPKGGGNVRARIEPCRKLESVAQTTPGEAARVKVISRSSGLPGHVRERQMNAAAEALQRAGIQIGEKSLFEDQAVSPGSSLLLSSVTPDSCLGSDSIGARGKPAELVGSEAAGAFVKAAKSGAMFDSHLADMVIPLLSLSDSQSAVRVPEITPHLDSGLRLANLFTGCTYEIVKQVGSTIVRMSPSPDISTRLQHNQ
ncbi:MAG TPA: RNA 3'-terminal phosphate cyclase, partial [Nitrososphaerales archaeon]|nr:RNA 3'-terminal phosphate cyclase [Nitrososphaerales archaeon]